MTSATLLLSNLHCPSCVRHTEQLLLAIPRITNVSVSLLTRSAVLTIDTGTLGGLDTRGASLAHVIGEAIRALSEVGGFEVKVETYDGLDRDAGRLAPTDEPQTVNLQRHAEFCESCKGIESASSRGSHVEALADAAQRTNDIIQTTLSIEGMTCASCSGSLTKAVMSIEGVIEANISVLNHSGIIKHHQIVDPSALVETIEDMGYGATIADSITIQPASRSPNMRILRSVYTIEGMTCASCARSITQALSGMEEVRSVSVDVLGNKAVIHHCDTIYEDQIRAAIHSAGYPARLHDSQPVEGPSKANDNSAVRTVKIRVHGIHCQQCVDKLNKFLGSTNIANFTPFAVNNNVTRIDYLPQRPWTLRGLLEGLDSVASDLSAEVVEKQSLLARGRELQRQELRFLAINCFFAFLFAIPSFIVHMLSMVILPHHQPLARYFMRPVWGAAELGTVIVWPLATCVQFGIGRIFYQHAFAPLTSTAKAIWSSKRRRPVASWTWSTLLTYGSMDLLVAMSTTVAYFSSLAMLIIDVRRSPEEQSVGTYFSEVVLLTMFILMGRVLEAYAKSRTGDAISLLGELRPDTALLLETSTPRAPDVSYSKSDSNNHQVISTNLLETGDRIRILPGSLPPADGIVVTGSTDFDEAALTGESRPVHKKPGDLIYTGTTNVSAAITMEITALGDATMLENIIQAVSDASTRKAPIEKLAERLTSIFVPTVVYLSLAVLTVWLALGLTGTVSDHSDNQNGGVVFWCFEFAIAVLVVACPCGIGLAVPCATAVGNGIAAKLGIIAAGGGEAFVGATRVGTIVFDKTGTLTAGKPLVTNSDHSDSSNLERRLDIEWATRLVEEQSTHPLAKSLVEHLSDIERREGIELIDSAEEPGRGMRASISFGPRSETATLLVGNLTLAQSAGAKLDGNQEEKVRSWSSQGKSIVIVAVKHDTEGSPTVACLYAVADSPRPTTANALAVLKKAGLRIVMASGDNEMTARAIGSQLGFDSSDIYGGVNPQGKAGLIETFKTAPVVSRPRHGWDLFSAFSSPKNKSLVMFIGDGLNDAVALAAADVGVAMGHGSQAIVSSADFVLLSSDLSSVPRLIDLSRRVTRRQKLNLAWACVFNMVAIPFAAGVFYPAGGIRLDPVWAAIVMACSSLSVVLSSLALRFGI